MTADLTTLNSKLDLLLAEVRAIRETPKPGITQAAFAKTIGRSARTVSRMVRQKKVRLEKGLVPHSEVRRFLS